MNRQEYIELVNDWNSFLLNEQIEKNYLLVESLILEEGFIADITRKIGKKGMLFLLGTIVANSPANAKSGSIDGIEQIRKELKLSLGSKKVKNIENLAKVPAVRDEIVARLNTQNNDELDELGSELDVLNPEDVKSGNSIDNFRYLIPRKASSIEAKKDNIISIEESELQGIFLKKTADGIDDQKEFLEELRKYFLKNVYNKKEGVKKTSDRFFITVNSSKYLVLIRPFLDKKFNVEKQNKIIDQYLEYSTKAIVDILANNRVSTDTEKFKPYLEKAIKAFYDDIRSDLNRFLSKKDNYAAYLDIDDFENILLDRIQDKIDWNNQTLKSNEISLKFNDSKMISGVIFLSYEDVIGFASNEKEKSKIFAGHLMHEIGHAISDKSHIKMIAKSGFSEFFYYIQENSNTSKFTVKDVTDYILSIQINIKKHKNFKNIFLKNLTRKGRKKIKKVVMYFLNQLIGLGASIKSFKEGNRLYFKFLVKEGNFYYFSPEERLENILSWIRTMDATSENIRIEKAIEFLEDLENIFEKDNSIVFKLLKIIYKKHIKKSKDVQGFPYFNIKNSSGEDATFHVSRKHMIKLLKVYINYFHFKKDHWKNVKHEQKYKILSLINFDYYGKGNEQNMSEIEYSWNEGNEHALGSIRNIIRILKERKSSISSNINHHDHDH